MKNLTTEWSTWLVLEIIAVGLKVKLGVRLEKDDMIVAGAEIGPTKALHSGLKIAGWENAR